MDAALAAALRVFWSKGYEGASLTELTEAMGVTRPSLYAAFGNKEALFLKALDLYEREKLAFMSQALEASTARGVAERILRNALRMQTGSGPKGVSERHQLPGVRNRGRGGEGAGDRPARLIRSGAQDPLRARQVGGATCPRPSMWRG